MTGTPGGDRPDSGPGASAERDPERDPERDTSRHEVAAPDRGDRSPGAPAVPRPAGRVPQRLPSRGSVPWEAQLFARMAAFGIVVGVAYWFLTYETAGSVLLFTFGFASGIAALAIFAGSLRARRHGTGERAVAAAPASDVEPVPRPTFGPLLLAVGLGLVVLGTVLGPWLLIAGLLVVISATKGWLGAAMDETDEARGILRSGGDE